MQNCWLIHLFCDNFARDLYIAFMYGALKIKVCTVVNVFVVYLPDVSRFIACKYNFSRAICRSMCVQVINGTYDNAIINYVKCHVHYSVFC